MSCRRYERIIYVSVGLVLGFIVLHPFAMILHWVIEPGASDQSNYLEAYHFFEPGMILMGLAFGLLGGLTGFLLTITIERGRRLLISEHEKEKREIALRTVHNLVVTLSHYLLNANMIIGGKVRHCRKIALNNDLLESLAVIEEQGLKIDAVLNSLRGLVEINTCGYTSDGLVSMIDISRELDERLSEAERHRSGSARGLN